MASATDALAAVKGLRKRDLIRFLESDPRVREWVAEQLLSTKEAAEVLGVERPRLWRWEKKGRLVPIARTGATPIYLRCDVEGVRDAEATKAAERNGEVT